MVTYSYAYMPQLVLIYRPRRDGRLSRPWCEVAQAVTTCRPGWGHIVAVKKDIITSVRLSRHSNICSRWCCREIIVNKGFLLLLTIISRQRHLLPILLCLESLTLVIISFLPISINNQSIAIILSTVILLSWRPPAYSLSWGALSY